MSRDPHQFTRSSSFRSSTTSLDQSAAPARQSSFRAAGDRSTGLSRSSSLRGLGDRSTGLSRSSSFKRAERPQRFRVTAKEAALSCPEDTLQAIPEVDPDPYVNSPLVPGLTKCTFFPYLRSLDVALVMYYDPCEVASGLAKLQIRGASNRTQRPNHRYVAVDCSAEKELCDMQDVYAVPSYQLFTRGTLLNSYMDVENLRLVDLQRFVETAPVADDANPMTCQTK